MSQTSSITTKRLTLIALLLTVGAPLVTLVSMVSSYRDRQDQNIAEIARLSKLVVDLQASTGGQNSDIQVFRQTIFDNDSSIKMLQRAQDEYNTRVLELWKETSANTAQIEALKTQVLMLQSEYRIKH